MEDELPATGRGVNILLEALEPDTSRIQVIDQLDELFEGPAQTIETPDDEGVSGPEVAESLS